MHIQNMFLTMMPLMFPIIVFGKSVMCSGEKKGLLAKEQYSNNYYDRVSLLLVIIWNNSRSSVPHYGEK